MEPTQGTPTIPSGTEDDPDLANGTVVGEYTVEGKLGQGGFGAVFKAVHPLIGKMVAIKVLSSQFSANREMVSRFMAEARAVNQIRHRNIIDIFSFGQLPDRRHYYVMEYVDGEPLDRRIARGPIPLAEAVPILRAIARALDTAHGKGIAHRDLKAENVFLGTDTDGAVFPKLLDFGIAKLLGNDGGIAHKTQTGAPMGTPYYMSPEQTRGRNVDHRTDHYAFGVLTYVMLTQKFPLDGEDYMTILMRQVNDNPAPASSVVSLGPAGERVDHVISWLMRKNPAERPPDLITAVQALEEVTGVAPKAPVSAPITIPQHITGPQLAATVAGGAITAQPANPVVATRLDSAPTAPASSKRGLAIGIGAVLLIAAAAIVWKVSSGPNSGSIIATPPAADAAMVAAIDAAPVVADAAVVAVDAAEATLVTVTLDAVPAGTEVKIAGQLYGTAPKVQVPRGTREVMLVLTADGYAPATVAITPDKDQSNPVKLKARGGTGSARPPRGSAGSGTGSGGENDILDFPTKKPAPKKAAPPAPKPHNDDPYL